MSVAAALDAPIIDVDSHVVEPADLWTSRLSETRFGAGIPRVEADPATGQARWVVGSTPLAAETVPVGSPDAAASDPKLRLELLDRSGISAQVLYPNLLGFGIEAVQSIDDPDLKLEIVRAYNDHVAEFASGSGGRLAPLMCLPTWDTKAAVAEAERGLAAGHRGIVFPLSDAAYGPLKAGRWDPIFDFAQSNDVPINLHAGFQAAAPLAGYETVLTPSATLVERGRDRALASLGNARPITWVIFSGACERFPRLSFVSVGSGCGYLPFLLDMLDWQWHNNGAAADHPGRPYPRETFARQIYATVWFEQQAIGDIEPLAANIMFQTEYSQPTGLTLGSQDGPDSPRNAARRALSGFPEPFVRGVLHDNAARVYGLN